MIEITNTAAEDLLEYFIDECKCLRSKNTEQQCKIKELECALQQKERDLDTLANSRLEGLKASIEESNG